MGSPEKSLRPFDMGRIGEHEQRSDGVFTHIVVDDVTACDYVLRRGECWATHQRTDGCTELCGGCVAALKNGVRHG